MFSIIVFLLKFFFKEFLFTIIYFSAVGDEAVQELNKALEKENFQEFYKILMNPNLGLSDNIDEFAIPLYYEEMKIDCIESKV